MLTEKVDLQQARSAGDIEDVCKLGQSIWREYFPHNKVISDDQVNYMLSKYYNEPFIEKSIQKGEVLFRIVVDENSIGFFSYLLDEDDSIIYLKKAFIDRDWRARGLFSGIIMPFVEEVATSRKVKTVRLAVNRNNKDAIAVYRSCGFHAIEEFDVQIGQGFVMNDVLMEKKVPRAQARERR